MKITINFQDINNITDELRHEFVDLSGDIIDVASAYDPEFVIDDRTHAGMMRQVMDLEKEVKRSLSRSGGYNTPIGVISYWEKDTGINLRKSFVLDIDDEKLRLLAKITSKVVKFVKPIAINAMGLIKMCVERFEAFGTLVEKEVNELTPMDKVGGVAYMRLDDDMWFAVIIYGGMNLEVGGVRFLPSMCDGTEPSVVDRAMEAAKTALYEGLLDIKSGYDPADTDKIDEYLRALNCVD